VTTLKAQNALYLVKSSGLKDSEFFLRTKMVARSDMKQAQRIGILFSLMA
jgi:hypothetical protein